MYAGPAKAITGSVINKSHEGSEMMNFVEVFRYLGHIMTADCRDDKDIKKQFRRQNAVGNLLVRKFSFTPIEAKIQLFKSYCYLIYGCALWRHSFQNSIRKLTVSYSDAFKRLINVPRYTSSSLAFAMNATDNINVVFYKFAYSLMNREIASPNSIATAIVNSAQSEVYRRGNVVDHWNSSVARRSPLKAILGFPIIFNHFQYRKCRFPDIGLLLDMPMISGAESLEFTSPNN